MTGLRRQPQTKSEINAKEQAKRENERLKRFQLEQKELQLLSQSLGSKRLGQSASKQLLGG